MKPKILLVDDEEVVLNSCLRILAGNNYQIDTQMDSRCALAAIGEIHYDLIIADLMMPYVGGLQILQKAKESNPNARVILITGLAQNETAERAKNLGAFAYLPKPFDPDEFGQLVQEALEDI